MNSTTHRLTLAAGILVALAGIVCAGGGVLLLAWRIIEPQEAVILPPGMMITPESTPTPGVLSLPVAPPPMPTNAAELVILPVSDLPTPAPVLTDTRTFTAEPSRTPSSAPSRTQPQPATAAATRTATRIRTVEPSNTPPPTYTGVPPAATQPAIPDRIVIEKIGLDAPVVAVSQHPIWIGGQVYSQWDVPDDYAAGWHQHSAPLGTAGNTVLNGHHNVNGAVFYYLIRLQPGDMVALESGAKRYLYVVVQTMMLAEEGQPLATRQANARWILPTGDERVTLITCWPYEASTHRWVVIALSANALDHLTGIP